jgi:hypothetical protein
MVDTMMQPQHVKELEQRVKKLAIASVKKLKGKSEIKPDGTSK